MPRATRRQPVRDGLPVRRLGVQRDERAGDHCQGVRRRRQAARADHAVARPAVRCQHRSAGKPSVGRRRVRTALWRRLPAVPRRRQAGGSGVLLQGPPYAGPRAALRRHARGRWQDVRGRPWHTGVGRQVHGGHGPVGPLQLAPGTPVPLEGGCRAAALADPAQAGLPRQHARGDRRVPQRPQHSLLQGGVAGVLQGRRRAARGTQPRSQLRHDERRASAHSGPRLLYEGRQPRDGRSARCPRGAAPVSTAPVVLAHARRPPRQGGRGASGAERRCARAPTPTQTRKG